MDRTCVSYGWENVMLHTNRTFSKGNWESRECWYAEVSYTWNIPVCEVGQMHLIHCYQGQYKICSERP